jgi:hypothetical protein
MSAMFKKHATAFIVALCAATSAWGLEADLEVMPVVVSAPPSTTVDVEVLVSSPEQIAAVTFTVQYSSTAATFVSATNGSAVSGAWTILVVQNVQGGNVTPGTDRNVYVQIIGSGVNWFTGTDRQVAVLRFALAPTTCRQTALAFTPDCDYTYLSTLQLVTICNPSLQSGQLRTTCATDAPGAREIVKQLRNVPNPFNPSTTIVFELAASGPVELRVFDVAGRTVRHLVNAELSSGRHEAHWDGRDDGGRAMPGGVYLYRLVSGAETAAQRMVLLK